MKSTCTSIVQKIRSRFQLTFQVEPFELFLKEIYLDLTKRSSNTTLEKHIFIDYMNFPILISEKIFLLMTSSKEAKLKDSDFIYSLSKIYLGEIESHLQIFTSLFDLSNDEYVHKSDVYILLSLLDYKNLKETKEIADAFFNESKSLKKEEFITRSTESNLDIFILFMVYLLSKAPFDEEQINYFNKSKGNNMRHTHSNGNVGCNSSNNIGGGTFKSFPSKKLIEFISKRFDLYLGIDDSSSESLDDEYSDLAELMTFEQNVSCVLSNIEINVLNPKIRKTSLDDYLLKEHYTHHHQKKNENKNKNDNNKRANNIENSPSFNINDSLRKGSFQMETFGFTPGTVMQCNMKSQAQISIKSPGLPLIKSSSSLLTFDYTNNIQMIYQDMNNTIKQCRLVLISNCLFIETEIDISNNYSDYLASLRNSLTYDTIASFKYTYLISLSTSFTENIGKSTLPGLDGISFFGFKVLSLLNGIKKEMRFFTKNKSQLDHFMTQIHKTGSNSGMLSNFDIINQIGKGEYSRVYLAKDLKSSKAIALKELCKGTNSGPDQDIKLKWEKDILMLLSSATHPNVIKSYYNFRTQSSLYFVLEFVPNGTLSSFLAMNKGNIDIYTKYNIIKQLCFGLSFLHSLKIVHCDLKPDNILLSIHPHNTKDITIKITDFGFSQILTKNQLLYESFGTLAYIGPEILKGLPYSFQVDIWSLGVIIFQILFEEIPFGESSNDLKEIKTMIVKGKFSFPEMNNNKNKIAINKVYYEIISKCLNVDSTKRPKCKEIISLIHINAKVNDKDNDNYNEVNSFKDDEHYDNIENLNTKH